MNQNDLPERWKNKIKEYLKEKGSRYETISASDFQIDESVEIKFEDGSFASFKYPLIIEAPEFQEVGVMTEHCGYFIIHSEAIQFKLIKH